MGPLLEFGERQLLGSLEEFNTQDSRVSSSEFGLREETQEDLALLAFKECIFPLK